MSPEFCIFFVGYLIATFLLGPVRIAALFGVIDIYSFRWRWLINWCIVLCFYTLFLGLLAIATL
jgi:hypothetical protein